MSPDPVPPSPPLLEDLAAAVGASLVELRTLSEALEGPARSDAERLTERLESASVAVQSALNRLASEADAGKSAGEAPGAAPTGGEARPNRGRKARKRAGRRPHRADPDETEERSAAQAGPGTADDDPWTTVQLGAKHPVRVASLSGHTASVSVSEVLGFLANLRKSGTLEVRSPAEEFQVELRDGSVVYAHGANPPEGLRLGQILVHQGALTQDRLEAFFAAHPEGAILGRGLLEEGLVTEEALRIALAFQAQNVFHRLFASHDAVFEFRENVHVDKGDDIRLDVMRLLLESARSHDERRAREEAQVHDALSWLDD